jgi:chitinase
MMRWMAGLVAVLVLPACGDGGGSHSGTDVQGLDPSGHPAAGQASNVRIISPDTGTSTTEGSNITIRAVADLNVAIARVDFYDDNRLIGSKSSPPYDISYKRLKTGTHELCAVAFDLAGNPTASPPVTLFVVHRTR